MSTKNTFRFVRYVDGQEMAEGIVIELAPTLEMAIKKALRLCPKRANTVLVYVPPNREWTGLAREDIEQLAAKHLKVFTQFEGAGDVWYEGEQEFAQAINLKLKEMNNDS
jgi:hypothetical protein